MAITAAQAAAWLPEAQTAYHALVLGGSARVVVDQNGERVEYTSANRAALSAYIAMLEGIIAGISDNPGPLKVLM